MPPPSSAGPVVILGAGYAGVKVAQDVHTRSRGRVPVLVIDRLPVHVLKTELYDLAQLADSSSGLRRWAIPLGKVLDRPGISVQQAEVRAIDLDGQTVRTDRGTTPYGSLAICLGNVPAYYGVPGADRAHQVYGLASAIRAAGAVRDLELDSATWKADRRPRVMVVGGGSTGTEVAAQVATVDWTKLVAPRARRPQVILVCGALPFLAGLPEPLVRHARSLLYDAGVVLHEGVNVRRIEADHVELEDGATLPFDLLVWAAGVQAPDILRTLPTAHGRGGRLIVDEGLELPGHPGAFGVGDVIEFKDPKTRMLVPGTAQAAISEARVAAANLVARRRGTPLKPFVYRERATIVSLGVAKASADLRGVSLWGRPAALLKTLVEREYSVARGHGR